MAPKLVIASRPSAAIRMKRRSARLFPYGPKANFRVGKEPFGLSPSKPRLVTVRAELVEALGTWHEGFDKLSLALRQAQGERGWRADRRQQPQRADSASSFHTSRVARSAMGH
jgi:hypothetical protein